MTKVGNVAKQIVGSVLGLGGLLWLGLQIDPGKLPPPGVNTQTWGKVDLPNTLPEPVHAYLQATLGRTIPHLDTAFIRGRTRCRLGPVWLPLRSQTYYAPGQFYRHLVATWFGLPLFKTTEAHLADSADHVLQRVPTHNIDASCGPCLDAWAEMIWLPPVLVTDHRLRWEAVDQQTSRLHLPCSNHRSVSLLLHFDLQTGLLRSMTGHRPRGHAANQTPYQVSCSRWRTVHGMTLPTRLTFCWADEDCPRWIRTLDEAYYNIDVSTRIPFQQMIAPPDPPPAGWLKDLTRLVTISRPFEKTRQAIKGLLQKEEPLLDT